MSNVLYFQLKSSFSRATISEMISSAFALEHLHLSREEKTLVSQGYMDGLHAVFASFSLLIAIHFCACMCIQDRGLKCGGKQQTQQED